MPRPRRAQRRGLPAVVRRPRGRARRGRRCRRPAGSRSAPARSGSRSAFCTVTGLARCCATSARVDGSRAPGRRGRDPARAAPSAIRALLSSDMTQESSATLRSRTAALPATRRRPAVGLRRRRGVLVHRAVHPGRRRRPVAAVHRLRPGGRRRGARRRSRSPITRQRLPQGRQWVAARRRRRRRRRRLPAAHLVRAHHRARPATAPSSIALLPAATAVMAVAPRARAPAARVLGASPALGALAAIGFASAQGGGLGAAALGRPAAVRRRRRRGDRLRRGRAARPRARLVADGVVGARASARR